MEVESSSDRPRPSPTAKDISLEDSAIAHASPIPCTWLVNSPADEQPTIALALLLCLSACKSSLCRYWGAAKRITTSGGISNFSRICMPSETPAWWLSGMAVCTIITSFISHTSYLIHILPGDTLTHYSLPEAFPIIYINHPLHTSPRLARNFQGMLISPLNTFYYTIWCKISAIG